MDKRGISSQQQQQQHHHHHQQQQQQHEWPHDRPTFINPQPSQTSLQFRCLKYLFAPAKSITSHSTSSDRLSIAFKSGSSLHQQTGYK